MAERERKEPLVSIIVPYKSDYPWLRECVGECKKLDYKNFEIILLPDSGGRAGNFPGCRVIPTGVVNISAKRNAGMRSANGSVCAFIDSDAYPHRDWLKNGVKYLEDESIGIIGGPNLTPPGDTLMQKVSGDVLGSMIGAGGISERYSVRKERDTDILPSVNMLVRMETFERLSLKWDETLVTGEDAKICHEIADSGKRIHYSPDVVVYHHRRAMFLPHMEQIWNYARDEGLLLRQRGKPDRLLVLMPPLFALWFAFGAAIGTISREFALLYAATLVIYAIIIAIASVSICIARSPLIFLGIALTHITYGAGIWRGLLLPRKYFSKNFRKRWWNR